MKKRYFILYFLLLQNLFFLKGQPKKDSLFISPLKIPLLITGGFAELRANHIHSGIDLSTKSEIGQPVYAAANGFISRIKVEAGGFGKAVYIDHPSGYTTVYAHLDAFRDDIAEYVRNQQYAVQKFSVDLFPEKDRFIIKQGDSIAFSGNSGGSTGPHLHFEIRDMLSQKPVSPLQFRLPVKDTIAPCIYNVAIYPVSSNSNVFGQARKVIIPVAVKNDSLTLSSSDTILINGNIGIGAEVFDGFNNAATKTGVYRLSLYLDSKLYFQNQLSTFSFSETRYVNSMIDYEEYFNNRKKIIKFFLDPNNKLSTYTYKINNGLLNFNDTIVHAVKIEIQDAYGNSNSLSFFLKQQSLISSITKETMDSCTQILRYQAKNEFRTDSVRLVVPDGALYKDFCLKFKTLKPRKDFYSNVFCLQDIATPFQSAVELYIRPLGKYSKIESKGIIARLDERYNAYSIGGTFDNGFIRAKTYMLGCFTILLDTISPKIRELRNFTTKYNNKEYIAFRITDNLSGIKEYRGYIDGKWALFEYDAKNDIIMHMIDKERFTYTPSTKIKIVAIDEKENTASLVTRYRPLR